MISPQPQTVRYRPSLRDSLSNTTNRDLDGELYLTVEEPTFQMPRWEDVDEHPAFCKRDFQKGYIKPDPDKGAFAGVPTWVTEKIGYQYGQTTRFQLAVLAGFLHYSRLSTEEASVEYVGGRTVNAPENQFVVSILSVAENLHARLARTTGRDMYETEDGSIHPSFKKFYNKANNAARKLVEWGYLRKLDYVEGTSLKGTYWTFEGTPLEDYATGGTCETVNVMPKTERVFLDLEADRFSMAEACTSKYQRHRYLKAQNWNDVVAQEGASGDRHVSVGNFRPEDVRMGITEDKPTAIPYVILEPEAGDILERHETTRRILSGLHIDDVDLSQVLVAFSANNSFHIRIPAGMFGSRVFKTVDLGRRTIARWTAEYVDEELDTGLFDARHLIRMIGSRHEKTGRYVTAFPADEFMGLSLEEIAERSERHEPMELLDPFQVPICETLAMQLEDAAESLFRFYIPPWEEVDEHDVQGGAVSRALEGVEEREIWHEKHQGRNKAAFVVACHLIKNESGWDDLLAWNTKNSPPLPEHELKHCYRSATRTIKR